VGTNGNVSSASSINLRGLGADASLTLLNGHRLPQDSAVSGVDISAIPIGAIDRIEVIADGASAIYGSDAVGGVANVILRHDFEGILTSARLGSSTQGGDFQNQEGIVAGHRWSSGGFMATYDYDPATAITAGERAYANNMGKASTLIPSLSRHAVVVTAHQAIGDRLTLSVDGLYNRRVSAYRDDSTTGSAYANMYNPSLETLDRTRAGDHPALILAKQADDELRQGHHPLQHEVASATANNLTTGCYCDEAFSAEANADGPLFRLPAAALMPRWVAAIAAIRWPTRAFSMGASRAPSRSTGPAIMSLASWRFRCSSLIDHCHCSRVRRFRQLHATRIILALPSSPHPSLA
jgi:hypothetical protein